MSIVLCGIMVNSCVKKLINELKGFAIFIEAVILAVINKFLFGDYESIINFLFISRHSVISPTNILAILTILLLSIGFIYYIGYFIGYIYSIKKFRLNKEKIYGVGGKSLREQILPHGALFLLAISIPPLMKYPSKYPLSQQLSDFQQFVLVYIFGTSQQISDIRYFIILNFVLVFLFGLFNEIIIQLYLNDENKFNFQVWKMKWKITSIGTKIEIKSF